MSDGNKKPGMRDISDLKARLGMLNTGGPAAPGGARPPGGANPFAPKAPAAPPAAPMAPAAPAAPPATPVAAAPAAPRAVAPAAPQAPAAPGGLNLGGDLFKKPAAPAAPAVPAGAGLAPASLGPAQAKPSQADLAAMFDAPASQLLDESPKPEAEFANPLQQGAYAQAAAPVDLSAQEMAALESYEGKQAGMKPSLAIGLTIGVSLLTLAFGYFIGDALQSRRLINFQIDASVRVKERVQPIIESYEKLKVVLMTTKGDEVEWAKIKQIPKDLMQVDASVLSSPVPLTPELNKLLTRYVVDVAALFEAAREQRDLTEGRDRAELEAMAAGSSFMQNKRFAVLYDPVSADATGPYIPPVGKVVAVTGTPEEREVEKRVGRRTQMVVEYFLPITDREGKEASVNLRRLLQLKKDQFSASGKANPMTLYTDRVDGLKTRVKQIETYREAFEAELKRQAEREKVFSL